MMKNVVVRISDITLSIGIVAILYILWVANKMSGYGPYEYTPEQVYYILTLGPILCFILFLISAGFRLFYLKRNAGKKLQWVLFLVAILPMLIMLINFLRYS